MESRNLGVLLQIEIVSAIVFIEDVISQGVLMN